MSGPDSPAAPYGLRRPTVADARQAVYRVHGDTAPAIWRSLLSGSRLSGDEEDTASLTRLIETMTAADPVTKLCAEALRIRLASHTHLSAAHAITRS
jgi:hypothetical protein